MKDSIFSIEKFCDDLGPKKVIHLHDPRAGLRAIVVVDNTACGPAIGGVRMAEDVTLEEVFGLARAMTLKNVAAGLPHGGGKSGIQADPKKVDKQRLIRAFALAIRNVVDYIPGPDMGTDEACMAWVHDEIRRAVGLPRVLGGIPLDEIGATGYGVAQCAEIAAPHVGLSIKGAKVAIEGFGNVGRPAARFLEERGAVLVAASDSQGAIHDPNGIPVEALLAVKEETGRVTAYKKGTQLSKADLLTVPCDILIPAARPNCLREDNAGQVQAKLILQGANIPATRAAERILHERGVIVVPDFIANAGGVICASVEYHGGTESSALDTIAEKIRANTKAVLDRSKQENILPRQAAEELARERLSSAMSFRRTV